MFTVWNPIACQGKSSTGNCGRAPNAWAGHSFALRMFASVTCDSLNSIPIPGRSSRKTEEGALRAETKARAEATIKRAARKE